MNSVCTGGENLLSGKDAGEIKLFKGVHTNLLYSFCITHSINLCISSALKIPNLVDTLSLTKKAFSFFKRPERSKLFMDNHDFL